MFWSDLSGFVGVSLLFNVQWKAFTERKCKNSLRFKNLYTLQQLLFSPIRLNIALTFSCDVYFCHKCSMRNSAKNSMVNRGESPGIRGLFCFLLNLLLLLSLWEESSGLLNSTKGGILLFFQSLKEDNIKLLPVKPK